MPHLQREFGSDPKQNLLGAASFSWLSSNRITILFLARTTGREINLGGELEMHRNSFFACVLAVACFTILTPSLGAAQTAIVKSLMAALRADTEALGAPKVQGGNLYFGNTKVSADTIGFGVVKRLGGDASVFVKSGDQFVRVATTLKKEDGTSAVGTALAGDSPALPKLNAGQAYYGDATTFGKTYDTGYVPIKDASGAVIGAFFVGNPK
jgi:Cache 3/Cache 2 fusion domain